MLNPATTGFRVTLSERKRRDANQIKYEVLTAALPGEKKTHIMYESGLNVSQLNLYLEELMSHGALEFEPLGRKYSTTDRGRSFVRAFNQYKETIDALYKDELTLAQFFPNSVKSKLQSRQNKGANGISTKNFASSPFHF
jgi:predicted transcriptional regulator